MKGILGRKIGMTQVFTETGVLVPVTVVAAQPNIVLQVKTKEKEGYNAVKIGFEDKRLKLVTKPVLGQFQKAKTGPKRFVKEIKNMDGYNVGDNIPVSIFAPGEFVDVSATSKGKGFAGSIKRHNYSRGPMGHGSGYHRGVGSMGAIAPNRIMKSKLMPGHMGHEKVTVENLEVVSIDTTKNIILIKGSIPGPNKQLITIKNTLKKPVANKPLSLLSRS